MQFIGYVISQGIYIEDKRITAMYDLFETQSIRDILMFLRFANFYT